VSGSARSFDQASPESRTLELLITVDAFDVSPLVRWGDADGTVS